MNTGSEHLGRGQATRHADGAGGLQSSPRSTRDWTGLRANNTAVALGALLTVLSGAFLSLGAQQPQIPTLQVCNETMVTGKALVKIASRTDATHAGTFRVAIDVKCD